MNVKRFFPSADEAASLFVTTQPDTLAVIQWPHSVACGYRCPPERINWEYCTQHDIPVIYTAVDGASYYYREGDALLFALVTHERITQRQFLDAVCAQLALSVPVLFVEDNDLRLGPSRCGMASPELQRPDGAWLNALEVLIHSDLEEARRALAFPVGVWDHKPVSVLEDWIHPLDNELGGDTERIAIDAVVAAARILVNG